VTDRFRERRAAQVVAWIDEDRARRERNHYREQGRNEVLQALVTGKLQIQNPVTGEWIPVPTPWAEGDPNLFGVTAQQVAEMVVSYHGLPPADDAHGASLDRLQAIREADRG
jgi:hypothetical protein